MNGKVPVKQAPIEVIDRRAVFQWNRDDDKGMWIDVQCDVPQACHNVLPYEMYVDFRMTSEGERVKC